MVEVKETFLLSHSRKRRNKSSSLPGLRKCIGLALGTAERKGEPYRRAHWKLREWQDPPLQASHLQGLTTSWQAFVRDLFGYGGTIR
jgi:hypothetical protein